MPDASNHTNDTPSLDQLIGDLNALEMLADGWDEAARNGAHARAEAVDALNKEAFRRLIRALKDLPEFSSALRAAAQDEVVYAVLRRHGILKASLYERVEAALETVRPSLASHGGDAEVASVEGNRAEIRFLGACDGCPASQLTFYAGVKKAIQEQVPEITEVKQAKGLGGGGADGVQFTSPFANYGVNEWSVAMRLDDLADGETRIVDVDDNSVIITRFAEKVSCFKNACAHMGLEMTQGEIAEAIITCPHHGFKYALESGECLTAPEVQLHPHAVRVKGPNIEVRIVT
ncbi:Fe-S cluster biogenesis protein NfuA, 4Fe-4S-binding domain [Roseovarius lutimaris]|uniref:Fe-S cluster biogenesis protein NfuA, 4Fe-4S-binding domain n=1 Tax=Roseovarius lutimaris TaxID=1005928 RepID=A0A1I5GIQ8_9RHOB|nr:NifU family protein [Roseovarius lutimaris]SFO35810.1 Fe-S cluster biogenesis protein NfuA, 4Fe-4S-binding domain [Roseovarius lutimaris]